MWDLLIVHPMTNILLWIYSLIVQVPLFDKIGAFGIAIILFTILIRMATHPLMASQIKTSKAQQEMMQSKEWLAIQKKYEKDKEKLAAEQMKFYQEKGINPFGACLPTLIQFPIIIGLYQSIIRALATSPLQLIQLNRGIYDFLDASKLIPLHNNFLWMNLGQPEGIDVGLPFAIPTLAIIVAATTFLQTKLSTPPVANPNDQSAAMSKTMALYMPFLLGYFALTFASGLAVYFVVSNLFSIAQYAVMGRLDWRNLFGGGDKELLENKKESPKKK